MITSSKWRPRNSAGRRLVTTHPTRSAGGLICNRADETYIRVAGAWTYLYRAVDSTGATIDFMLSPKRDVVAAKHFLQMALWRAGDGRANGATPPALRFQVQRFIVCFMILPASEDDSNPFIGQRPYCCLMRLAAVSLESIIGSSPL